MLASRGIASLALAYFAHEDLPKTTDHFDLDYFEEAVEILLSQPEVVPDRCGVVAISKATDVACCMATYLTQVKAVVIISGSAIALDSVITHRGHTLVKGFKLDVRDMSSDQDERLYPRREVMKQEAYVDNPKFIPIEQADDDTYFMMVVGGDDAWSLNLFLNVARERMDRRGRGAWLETVEYPGAGHILEPPYMALTPHSYQRYLPVNAEDGSTKLMSVKILWGGKPKDHCHAQEDLWSRMLSFFTKHISDSSS